MAGPSKAALKSAAASAAAANKKKQSSSAVKDKKANEKQRLKDAGKKYAQTKVQESFEQSHIEDKSSNYPQFQLSEVSLGKILGKGGFGTVYEVRGFDIIEDTTDPATKSTNSKRPKQFTLSKTAQQSSRAVFNTLAQLSGHDLDLQYADDESEVEDGMVENKKFIAEHCVRKNSGEGRYAAKILSPDVVADPSQFIQGIMDMATETRVLSDTDHPNIIRMRSIASISPYDDGYFIIMDRLKDILDHRIKTWRLRRSSLDRPAGGFHSRCLRRWATDGWDLLWSPDHRPSPWRQGGEIRSGLGRGAHRLPN